LGTTSKIGKRETQQEMVSMSYAHPATQWVLATFLCSTDRHQLRQSNDGTYPALTA